MPFKPFDAVPVGSVGESAPVEPIRPDRPDEADLVPSTPIGLGKPLSIKIRSVYPGPLNHQAVLVSSVVDNPSLYEAGPRGIQYLLRSTTGRRIVKPVAVAAPGSDVIYYSPAVLDASLGVKLSMSFDDFDKDRYQKYVDVAAKAAGLPVFAVAAGLGGGIGAAAGTSLIYAASRAIKVVLGAVDRRIDGNNAWTGSARINIEEAGLRRAKAGWLLFYADGSPELTMIPDHNRQLALDHRGNGYVVNTDDGTLRYRNDPDVIVADGEPYVLAFVNGAAEEQLKDWTRAAVSAAMTEKFLKSSGDVIEDVGALMEIYNDLVMARRVGQVDHELEDTDDPDELAKLRTRRKALIKNVQDKQIKDLLE